jgi:hypothetical protein
MIVIIGGLAATKDDYRYYFRSFLSERALDGVSFDCTSNEIAVTG